MAKASCDGCGRTVTVAGGIANLWSFESTEATAMTLEFPGGESYLLCFPCIEALPEEPSPADVEVLDAHDADGADSDGAATPPS